MTAHPDGTTVFSAESCRRSSCCAAAQPLFSVFARDPAEGRRRSDDDYDLIFAHVLSSSDPGGARPALCVRQPLRATDARGRRRNLSARVTPSAQLDAPYVRVRRRGALGGLLAEATTPTGRRPAGQSLDRQAATCLLSGVGDVFKALADPTRRAILDELQDRDGQTLFELCARLATKHGSARPGRPSPSTSTSSRRPAGHTRRQGRYKFHHLDTAPLDDDRRAVARPTHGEGPP